jgi:sporulation integral membrane protein YtvI
MALSTFFFLVDRDRIKKYIAQNVPHELLSAVKLVRDDMFSALLGYVKAQLKLMCIIFILLFISFSLLQVGYAFFIAAAIAIMDALPVLGTSMALIPWALYSLMNGNYFQAVWLLVTYLICTGTRNFIEPKLVSSNIGVFPLITLGSMYAGLRIFGVSGLLLGPVIYIIFRTTVTTIMKGKTIKEYFFVNAAEEAGGTDGIQ